MRKLLAVLLFAAAAGAMAQERAVVTQLAQGIASYRAGDAAAAVRSLSAVTGDLLQAGPAYVETGVFASLEEMETALVYLALSQLRLGEEDRARETLLRLHAAERILPTYATLDIGRDAADLEALNAALLPATPLPRNVFLIADDPAAPLPPLVPRTGEKAFETLTPAQERAERQGILDALSAPLAIPVRIAEAAPQTPVAPTVAPAAPTPVRVNPMPPAAPQRAPSATPVAASELLVTLRDAESAANSGDVEAAARSYAGVAVSPAATREILAAAAVGLYRTAAFREAAAAFQRIGTFRRGEEDLRYYYAVSLYESGRYVEARTELACALPFLVETEEVARNRYRIEMFAQQARY